MRLGLQSNGCCSDDRDKTKPPLPLTFDGHLSFFTHVLLFLIRCHLNRHHLLARLIVLSWIQTCGLSLTAFSVVVHFLFICAVVSMCS